MSVKILNSDQAPNRKNRQSYVYDLPEWGEVLDALPALVPGKVLEVMLSKDSLARVGTRRNKVSYFGQVLRGFFKNNRMAFTTWSRSFPDGSERCYIKRVEPAKAIGHTRAAS